MLLRRRIELFLQRSRMPPTRFGRNAVRDPRLVFDMRNGRRLRPPTARKVQAYLDEQESRMDAPRTSGTG